MFTTAHNTPIAAETFMGALKIYYSEQLWIHQNNRKLSSIDIAELFGKT